MVLKKRWWLRTKIRITLELRFSIQTIQKSVGCEMQKKKVAMHYEQIRILSWM